MSPSGSPNSLALRSLRIILPLLVFGIVSTYSMSLGATPEWRKRRLAWLDGFPPVSGWHCQIGLDLPDRASVEPTGDRTPSPVKDAVGSENFGSEWPLS